MPTVSVRPAADEARALRALHAVEPYAIDGASAEEMTEGCALFDVVESGRVVGAVAVELRGRFATIKAAASDGVDTPAALRDLEALLRERGAQHVAFFTRRPGLVRSMLAAGYRLREAELEKEL